MKKALSFGTLGTHGRDFLESAIIVALAAEQKISHRERNNETSSRLKINEIVT